MENMTEKPIVVQARSTQTYGIQDAEGMWHNYPRDKLPTEEVKKAVADLKRGDEILLLVNARDLKTYYSFSVTRKSQQNFGGKSEEDMVSFDDLLQQAHKEYPHRLSIQTDWLNSGNLDTPVFKATVCVDGQDAKDATRIFNGHGEATDDNTQEGSTRDAKLRMAETRAISRALRFLLNSGIVKEELPGKKPETSSEVVVSAEDLETHK